MSDLSSPYLHPRTGKRGITIDLPLPAELVDAIAERVLERLADHQPEHDGWLRGADQIANYIAAPTSRIYALAACKPPRIPIVKDGSALLAKRSELDNWLRNGGGTRP